MNAKSAATSAARQPEPLKPGLQSTLSLLLIIHLFAMASCFFSVLPSSDLQARLLTVLAPYVQLCRFDLDYRPFYLSRETLNDDTFPFYGEREYLIEVLPSGGDADEPDQWIRLDADKRRWWGSRHRFLRYADAVNFNADIDETVSIFARDIGRHWLATRETPPSLIRIRQHRPVPRQRYYPENSGADPADINPHAGSYFRTVYTARFLIDDNGDVSILKVVSAAETAESDTTTPPNPGARSNNR